MTTKNSRLFLVFNLPIIFENILNKTKKQAHAPALMVNQQCALKRNFTPSTHSTCPGRLSRRRREDELARQVTHVVCRTLLIIFYKTKKQAHAPALMINQQCSIFPAPREASILDDEKLNFCVRDGNRWTFSLSPLVMV